MLIRVQEQKLMDERLKYISAVQQSPLGSLQRQQALENLTEVVLRSRSMFRFEGGGAIAPIYREGLQALRTETLGLLDREINNYNGKPQWLTEVRSRALSRVLTQDYLQQLALVAQQYEPPTPQWQYAMQELINGIMRSRKLRGRGKFSQDVYQEAINTMCLWLYRKINTYDATKGSFMTWINTRLSYILLETRQECHDPLVQQLNGKIIRTKYQLTAIVREGLVIDLNFWLKSVLRLSNPGQNFPNPILFLQIIVLILVQMYQVNPQQTEIILFELAQQTLSLSSKLVSIESETRSIETIAQSPSNPSLSEQIRHYLESDPQGLCQVHCRANPQATFQAIALKRLDGESWQQISDCFNIRVTALSNCFQRTLQRLIPHIRSYIQGELD